MGIIMVVQEREGGDSSHSSRRRRGVRRERVKKGRELRGLEMLMVRLMEVLPRKVDASDAASWEFAVLLQMEFGPAKGGTRKC